MPRTYQIKLWETRVGYLFIDVPDDIEKVDDYLDEQITLQWDECDNWSTKDADAEVWGVVDAY